MIKKFQILTFITLSSIIIVSCNDTSIEADPLLPPQNNFQYPFQINTLWYYTTRNFVTNFQPDSINAYHNTDTILGFGGSVFVKDTIMNNDTLRLLSNTHSEPGHEHVNLEYYKQTDTGLIRVASYSQSTSFGPFRPIESNVRYEVNGLSFYSVRDILDYYKQDYSTDGKIIFDNPPVTALKYPIDPNHEWHLRTQSQTEIRKQYTTFETVTVGAGTFYCNKVKRNWYRDGVGPDPQIISYDYFSKDGIIKRELIIKDILVWGNFNQPIGYLDAKEEIEVNIYTHP